MFSVFANVNGESLLAGRLSFDQRQYTFVYAKSYQSNPLAISLDPIHLPLNQKEHISDYLFGAMRDASPDSWGRFLMAKRLNTNPEHIDEMACIRHSSNNRVGFLEFTEFKGGADVHPAPVDILTIDMLADGVRDIARGKLVNPAVLDIFKHGSSMGGARPKAAIVDKGMHYLAKFNRFNDPVNMCRCEHAAMTLAGKLGVNVAQTHIQQIDDIDILMVKRFDRQKKEKFPFISALTLSGRSEFDFMNSSYVELSNLTKTLASNDFKNEWFKRMLFNVLCNNDDDHLRNHGFQFVDGQWMPTPAYDIMPHAIHTNTYRLAIGLNHGDRNASFNNTIEAGQAMGIATPNSLAKPMIDGFKHWQSHFKKAGVCLADIQFFSKTFDREIRRKAGAGIAGSPDFK